MVEKGHSIRRRPVAMTHPTDPRALAEPTEYETCQRCEGNTEDARVAARAWLEAYGIRTEPYTRGGGDHPAMTTLPDAFTAFAHHRAAAGFARGVEAAVGALQRIGHPDNYAPSFVNGYSAALRSSVGAIRALIPATETPGGGGVAPEVVALNVARRALAPFAQLADVLTIIDAKNRNRECLLTISDPQRSRDIRALAIFDARDAIRQIDAVLALAPKTPE
jgi:hypothetical protein